MSKVVLIDGHSILNRAFYGVPELTNSKGLHTNAVYGFLNIMFRVIEDEKADHLAVAFDLKEPTFRHKMYEAYKGTRKPMRGGWSGGGHRVRRSGSAAAGGRTCEDPDAQNHQRRHGD